MINPQNIIKENKDLNLYFKEFSSKCNNNVEFMNVKIDTKDHMKFLKECEENKAKSYRCIIKTKDKINKSKLKELNKIKNLKIDQYTPTRVQSSRSLMNRIRFI